MPVAIRPYRPDDLPILKRITVEAFEAVSIERNIEAHFGVIEGHDWRWRKGRHIELDTARDPAGVFVAESSGEVVGYITTWIDREAGVGFIPNLALTAGARGQGLGRALIGHALRHFRRQGIRYVRIETLAQNPIGQSLYPSMGFHEVARQIHYCMELTDDLLSDGSTLDPSSRER